VTPVLARLEASTETSETVTTRRTPRPAGCRWPQVAGYEIVGELGRGGMGVVYKAKQLSAKRLVALKMIRDGALADAEHCARFRIEAEAAARFQHPNLVRIYEVGEHQGLPYFSMELAEGGSLDKTLAGRPLPPAEAAQFIQTLAYAVHYAHEKQILHRDLKPANIVLTMDGRPLITDFGLAKRLDRDTAMTASEAVMGTANYMAPEQADGQAKYAGPATDIYALGAILYELLTGVPPFTAATRAEVLLQVVADEPVAPTRLRPEVPPDLETICLKCLEKAAEERYASAQELAEDLHRHLAGQSIVAAPMSELERQERWARRAGFAIEEVMTYGLREVVFKARELHLNRTVALKIIAEPSRTDPNALARLRREAETVARLDHPNIVRIHSSGSLHGRTYLAFEFVAGGSLIERFVDEPVPPRQAAQLVQRLAEAMHYAHQRGVLHCSLKPSNITLAAEDVPKITNFSLSVLLKEPAVARHLSRRLPSYMAPEVMDNRADDIGPATDVYALGAILYKLLTGAPPFRAESLDQTRELVRTQMPAPPSSLRNGSQPDFPVELDEVCLKCLAKEPKNRYASAGDLARELGDFLSALPRVPGYEMRRELGRGSMSMVYEARQISSGRPVAIKLMSREFRYGELWRARLREVTEKVANLRLPNVVEMIECGERDGRPYFIMELLAGGSLQRRAEGQMPVAAAGELIRTLARTMQTIHERGVVHGNLKPSKVLLAADGTPKIRGFIVSQKQPPPTDSSQMTIAAPAIMGTPRYMAPEQLSGDTAAVGPATDVYALGLMLYELVTGSLPFRAATLWELMAQVLNEAPQPLRELRADVPADLEKICLICLEKKPAQRYASAGELAADLDRFLAGQAVVGRTVPGGGFWRWVAGWFKASAFFGGRGNGRSR
jgi:serine/threonine protein kinase